VKRIRDGEEKVEGETFESSLKYLMFLVDDVNQLFNCALSLYDLRLAGAIGRNSQKDPREYLPMLQKFESLGKTSPHLQKYSVDLHLGRFSSALKNLSLAGQEHYGECLDLIRSKSLYEEGLEAFSFDKSPQQWKEVMNLYGLYLSGELRNFTLAALVFQSIDNLEGAFDAYLKAGDWRSALVCALSLNKDVLSVAHEVVDNLKSNPSPQNLEDAARILTDYFGEAEVDEAVSLLCRAHKFAEARRVACAYYRDDLVKTDVIPSLKETYSITVADLTKRLERFDYCATRLRALRVEKREAQGDEFNEKDELESEIGSSLSVFTLSSQASITSAMGRSWSTASLLLGRGSQNKSSDAHDRRRQRKTRMKEGHPKEESYLLKELRTHAPKVAFFKELRALIDCLVQARELSSAAHLQKLGKQLLELAAKQEQLPMVYGNWPNEIYDSVLTNRVIQPDGVRNQAYQTWSTGFLDSFHVQEVKQDEKQSEAGQNEDNDELGYGLGLF
jgi:elongator complex protein 1